MLIRTGGFFCLFRLRYTSGCVSIHQIFLSLSLFEDEVLLIQRIINTDVLIREEGG